jgi:hypothetical protein
MRGNDLDRRILDHSPDNRQISVEGRCVGVKILGCRGKVLTVDSGRTRVRRFRKVGDRVESGFPEQKTHT